MNPLVYLLIGLCLGMAIRWLLAFRRSSVNPQDARIENELREQLQERSSELSELRTRCADLTGAHATAQAKHAAAERLLQEERQSHEQHLLEARRTQEK